MSKRTHVRALAAIGGAAVVAALGAVTVNASAAETSSNAAGAESARLAAAGVQNVRRPAESLIPANIRPPAGSKLIGAEIVRSGTQTYTCSAAGTYVGTSSVPEATLVGNLGFVHHFGGPSWQAKAPFDRSESKVTAKRLDGVDKPGTIPWLLLEVDTRTGTGPLSKTTHIQRLATSGGVAPATPCTAGEKVAVPYGAIYVFWG